MILLVFFGLFFLNLPINPLWLRVHISSLPDPPAARAPHDSLLLPLLNFGDEIRHIPRMIFLFAFLNPATLSPQSSLFFLGFFRYLFELFDWNVVLLQHLVPHNITKPISLLLSHQIAPQALASNPSLPNKIIRHFFSFLLLFLLFLIY